MFSIFRDADQLETAESQLDAMFTNGARLFDLAIEAIFAWQEPEEVQDELWSLDKNLNRTERAVRRELLIHGTVRGAEVDQGLMLSYMSVAKDLERIGDYCKNIWDLANIGVSFADDSDTDKLRNHAKGVASLLAEGKEAFVSEDHEAIHELIAQIQENAASYDSRVTRYLRSEKPGKREVPRALYFRYLKRISAHLGNALTSVVMPVDRIDFYKESKALDPESAD
jgi:phosphate uptake regulator